MHWAILNFVLGSVFFILAGVCAAIWFHKTKSHFRWLLGGVILFTGIGIGFLMFGQYMLDYSTHGEGQFFHRLEEARKEISYNPKITSWLGKGETAVFEKQSIAFDSSRGSIKSLTFTILPVKKPLKSIDVEFVYRMGADNLWELSRIVLEPDGIWISY